MKTLNLNIRIIFSIVFIITSCSVEKRIHNKGFHIKNNPKQITNTSSSANNESISRADIVIESNSEDVISQGSNDQSTKAIHWDHLTVNDTECDIIVFKDGQEKECIVKVITETDVKYVKCDNPTGPLYYANKSKIFMIKYANGTKDVLLDDSSKKEEYVYEEAKPAQPIPASRSESRPPSKMEANAVGSFIFAIASLFILAIPFGITAVILGILGLFKIANDPAKRGSGLAVIGIIVGTIAVILGIMILNSI